MQVCRNTISPIVTVRLICIVLLATQHAVLSFAQTNIDPTTQTPSLLEPDKPIEGELKGGDIHLYTLEPKAGQFVSVVVVQRTVGVVLVLFAPGGERLAEVDSPNGSKGSEALSFVANGSGSYRIEVRPREKTTTGRYQIRIEAIRAATSQEKDRDKVKCFAAALVFADSEEARAAMLVKDKDLVTVELIRELNGHGRRLRDQNKFPSSLIVSQFTLQLAERIGDKIGVSDAVYNIGVVLFNQRELNQALMYLRQSLELRESLGDNVRLADSLLYLGEIHQQQKHLPQAFEFYERSLTLFQELGNKGRAADILHSIASIHQQTGRYADAIEAFQKCQVLFHELGVKSRVASSLYNIGSIHLHTGNYADAIEAYQKGLIIFQETGSKPAQATALYAIGQVYFLQGNFMTSLEYNRKALALSEEAGHKSNSAWTLNLMALNSRLLGEFTNSMEYVERALSISESLDSKELKAHIFMTYGLLHHALGNRGKASEFYKESLILSEELKNQALIANALEKIGGILYLEGKFAEAMYIYKKCLMLNEAGGNKRQIVFTMEAIGNLYQIQGDHDKALEYRRKTLRLSEEIGNKSQIATALINIAYPYAGKGEFVQALESAERAAALLREIGNRTDLPRALYLVGLAYHGLKHFEKSRIAFEEAIVAIELTRASIAGQDTRSAFFATHEGTYEAYIDLLMQMHSEQPAEGHDVQAFQISQRRRARSLLELLNESRTQIDQGAVPELLERERTLQKQLNERAEQQTRLWSGKYTAEQAAALKKEIDSLTFEYRNNQAQIRLKSPRYAALTQPQPLTASEIQRDLLQADTVLLEYALGGKRSFLWVVTSTSLKNYELPGRAELENDVRRVVGLLNDGKRWASDETIAAEFTQVASPLSRKLLPPSVLSQLKGKRLVIVSDGALQYLPFGSLPLPPESNSKNGKQNTDSVPLAVKFETVNLPSASVLDVQRRDISDRKPPTKTIAIFADPVFSETDERLPAVRAEQPKINGPAKPDLNRILLERAFNFIGKPGESLSIPRLPFTRKEAEEIFASALSRDSLKALDFNADREKLLNADLTKYGIVHFATHGILHSEHPELSGIVLSLVNEKGEPVNGFLRLNEIYNMKLNADLVVLSACQTALGKEVRGEGLIGLTRGFMYAGTPRVVASLWKVDDVATAELMKIFYQKMLKEKMRPAAALREAKIAMMQQKRWAEPYYWAAFELQGDWR